MDFEQAIQMFAKAKRIKPEDFPAFRQRIIDSMAEMGFSTSGKIDMKQYMEFAKKKLGGGK